MHRPRSPAPRAAFDALLAYLGQGEGGRRVLLLDEVLELRTLESFPGLRGCLREVLDVLVRSPNRFVLTSRYVTRARRLLRDFAPGVEIVQLPPLSPREVGVFLARRTAGHDAAPRAELSGSVHALAAGRPSYVGALAAALSASNARTADPVGALTDQLAAGAPLSHLCRFSYELRLHRARGYVVLKAILAILAETEPLTLTEVARQLGRTPGSTKDYLSWLEDVDLIETRDKRYPKFNSGIAKQFRISGLHRQECSSGTTNAHKPGKGSVRWSSCGCLPAAGRCRARRRRPAVRVRLAWRCARAGCVRRGGGRWR